MRVGRIVIALLVLVSALAVSQTGRPGADYHTVLARELESTGWSASAVERFSDAASRLEWPEIRSADAEVVALALEYYRERSGDEFDLSDAAFVAADLAQLAAAMRGTGLRTIDVATATLAGVRVALADLPAGRDRSAQELGSIVRERVQQEVASRLRSTASGRGPNVAREVIRRIGTMPATGGSPGEQPGDPPVRVPGFGP